MTESSSEQAAVYADSVTSTSFTLLQSELAAAEEQPLQAAPSADIGSGDSAAVDDPFFCQVRLQYRSTINQSMLNLIYGQKKTKTEGNITEK